MKNKTINQINDFCNRNMTIQKYLFLSSDEGRYSNAYQNRYFNFVFDGRPRDLSITGNFMYGACVTELTRYTGKDPHKQRRNENFVLHDITGVKKLDVCLYLEINLHGISLHCVRYGIDFIPHSERYIVKSNSTFDEFNIIEYYEKNILKKLVKIFGN